ncbi:MAG TPA: oligosaccharide flippase family protein [Armatimonadota bacterium]
MELETNEVAQTTAKRRVMTGAVAYTIRQVVVTAISALANILLIRLLDPQAFGYIATSATVLTFLALLAEGGLGVYLIQQRHDPSDETLAEVATFQLSVYAALHTLFTFVLLGLAMAGVATKVTGFVWIALFTIPLNVLRASTYIRLERSLLFHKIAFIELTEAVAQTTVSLSLAFLGCGPWSILFGWLTKSAVGCLLAQRLAPWRFRPRRFRLTPEFRAGIKFGVEYYLPSLLISLYSFINPVVVGSLLGLSTVGFVDRSIFIAGFPLTILGPVVNKIFFPFVAKIQDDLEKVRAIVEEAAYWGSMLDKLFYLPLLLFTAELLQLFFTAKWLAIIPVLRIFMLGNMVFGGVSQAIAPVLKGMGQTRLILKYTSYGFIVSWALAYPLISHFGANGYAMITIIMWLGTLGTWLELRRHLHGVNILRPICIPLMAAGVAYAGTYYGLRQIGISVHTPITLALGMVLAWLLYTGMLLLLDGKHIIYVAFRMLALLRHPGPTATNERGG